VGTASPSFKHGRFSKQLPERLLELYHRGLKDKDLASMLSEIALVDVRLSELASKLGTDDSARIWRELKVAFAKSRSTVPTEAAEGELEMRRLINEGDEDRRLWADLLETILVRAKLSETETKRMTQLKMMVPVDRVLVLMHAVGDAVSRHVTNPAEVELVKRDLAGFIGAPESPEPLMIGDGENEEEDR